MNNELHQQQATKLVEKIAKDVHLGPYLSSDNSDYFKQIMHAQLSGKVVLPHGLGLSISEYQVIRKTIKDADLMHKELEWYKADWAFIRERAAFCAELFDMKKDELNELISLLSYYRNMQDPSSEQMAIVVATACLTSFHLWESIGLSDRAQLGELIEYNFPELYALNTENMRWKRFFYRQLCEQDGDYICKSPSCEECKSYSECFV